MGIEQADGYSEPTTEERRITRMKHLRVDGLTFADMVPVLISEGLIPEHGNHELLPRRRNGVADRRSEARADEVCARCEHTVHEQWKRNVQHLSADEASMLDARFLWINQSAKLIAKYHKLAIQDVKVTTTRRRKLEPKEGEPATDDYAIETTVREERRVIPQFFQMADDLREKIARLAGVPVGEVSSVPLPADAATDRRKKLIVRVRDERSGDEDAAPVTH